MRLIDIPPLYRFLFRSRTAVEDEELVCGRGPDCNAVLSGHGTTTYLVNTVVHCSAAPAE